MSSVVRVDTVELDSLASAWSRLAEELEEWSVAWRAASDARLMSAPTSERRHPGEQAHEIALDMIDLASRLGRASRIYDDVDALNTLLLQRTSDVCLWLAGRLLPITLCLVGPAALGVASVYLSRLLLTALAPSLPRGMATMSTNAWAALLSSPAVVRGVEVAVGSLDEAGMGAIGVPLPVTLGIGSAGLGITSLAGTSRLASRINGIVANPSTALAASAGAGATVPTSTQRLSTLPAAAPRDFADMLSRIPTEADGGAQVRIEEFGDTHVVYIGGTVDGSLGAGSQPWDMSSNLAALGGDTGASENAVRRAMIDAGIQQGDPVILVGHSQGGLVALRVAESVDVTARAVITAGSPIHAMQAPHGVPVVAFEHTDDVVPALGGIVTQAQPEVVYIREAGVTPQSFDGTTVLPAHRLDAYVATARTSAFIANDTVARVRAEVDALPRTGTSTLWRATRLEAGR